MNPTRCKVISPARSNTVAAAISTLREIAAIYIYF
jgi:hypothetical protein